MPNGIIIQWGDAYIAQRDGTLVRDFPKPFSSHCCVMVAVATGTKGQDTTYLNAVTVYSVSKTLYNITHFSQARTYDWIAIGF